jgi:hypothetical protein
MNEKLVIRVFMDRIFVDKNTFAIRELVVVLARPLNRAARRKQTKHHER